MPFEDPARRFGIGVRACFLSLDQHVVGDLPVDAFPCQLAAEGALAPWPRAVARLDPRPGERLVVEDPEVEQPLEATLDEVVFVSVGQESPANLVGRTGPCLEEP